jgi:hypothetical protein
MSSGAKRVHTGLKAIPSGASLASETVDEEGVRSIESGPITNRPQVANLPHKWLRINTGAEGFWKV